MIRLVSMLRRKPGMSIGNFQSYWRDVHGPLVASHQNRLNIIRYTQAHREVDANGADVSMPLRTMRGGMEPPYDGVEEYWFRSDDALRLASATAAFAEILANEERFVDRPHSPFWVAHEYPQVSTIHGWPLAKPKTGVVKVHFAIRQLSSLSTESAQTYWLVQHGPLVRSHASARGAICYQQIHRYDSDLLSVMRDSRGGAVDPYIGHAEVWLDRLTSRTGTEVDRAGSEALADERNFIDFDRSSIWTGKELLFVDRDW